MRKRIELMLALVIIAIPSALLFSPAPAAGANSLQTVLSPAGLSAYDTATAGSYFAVSQTDFDNAANNLTSVTKVGAPDSDRGGTCPSAWSSGYITVINNSIVIPANAYILGYAIEMASGASNSFTRLVAASSYKGSYDYIVGANYPNAGPGMNYYLFKEPVTTMSTRFIGQLSTASMCGSSLSTPTGGYLAASTPPFSGTFSTQTINIAFLQLLYTTVDQWAIPATISLSITGGAATVSKGGNVQLTTTQNKDGLVTFKANGKNIGKCISVPSASMTATCNWRPSVQGSVSLTATLKSQSASYATVTSSPLLVSANKRSNNR